MLSGCIKKTILFIYFFTLLGLYGGVGFSLAVVSGLLIAVASLVAVPGLEGMQASAAVARGLNSCSFRA